MPERLSVHVSNYNTFYKRPNQRYCREEWLGEDSAFNTILLLKGPGLLRKMASSKTELRNKQDESVTSCRAQKKNYPQL